VTFVVQASRLPEVQPWRLHHNIDMQIERLCCLVLVMQASRLHHLCRPEARTTIFDGQARGPHHKSEGLDKHAVGF